MSQAFLSPKPAPGSAPAWTRDRQAGLVLWYAAVFYTVAWAVHSGDHLRRGLGVVSTEVAVIGSVAAVLQLVAVSLVFLRSRWAPLTAAIVGFPDAVGIAAVHLLPHWSSFSDAFPGAHGTGVNAFSWFAAILEVVAALVFGAAGVYALRRASLDTV